MTDDGLTECVYCTPHLITEHDCTGCQVEGCGCGFDGDWHVGDPDRPTWWTDE